MHNSKDGSATMIGPTTKTLLESAGILKSKGNIVRIVMESVKPRKRTEQINKALVNKSGNIAS